MSISCVYFDNIESFTVQLHTVLDKLVEEINIFSWYRKRNDQRLIQYDDEGEVYVIPDADNDQYTRDLTATLTTLIETMNGKLIY